MAARSARGPDIQRVSGIIWGSLWYGGLRDAELYCGAVLVLVGVVWWCTGRGIVGSRHK